MNHEFDMLETRLAMIGDVVDVFALHEANVTNDGRPKQPLFYNKFKQVINAATQSHILCPKIYQNVINKYVGHTMIRSFVSLSRALVT